MAWTPENLTSPEFIKTQLTPLDRSNALLTMNNNIDNVEKALVRNRAALDAAQDLTNGPLSFGTVRDARNAAKEAVAAGAPNAIELQQKYEDLQARREIANAEASKYLGYVQSGEEALKTSRIAINNLVDAGAVPPGTSQFTPPAGSSITPSAQVPATSLPDENVNIKPNEIMQNPAPASVSDPTGTPFDDDGNLNMGWGLNENGDPVWVEAGYIDETGETVPSIQKTTTSPSDDHGLPYDDNGNLMPGWSLTEDGDPVWVGGGFVEPATVDSAKASFAAATTDPNKDHGSPYDDNGNLMPGWSLDEDNNPVWVGNDFVEPATAESAAQSRAAANTNVSGSTSRALTSNPPVTVTPYKQDDWRIRLSLAGSADYLYKVATKADILYPLIATDGVVFPYSPTINSSYRANYDPSELTHSNYKMFFYKNSSVDDITIGADFTAQDTAEANYMLAVIHFFKSATKMFYGQDTSPRAGTPPPLLYLTGYGLHQFQKHPLLLTNFSYNLPNDVDYIRAGSNAQWGGVSIAQLSSGSKTRLGSSGLTPGGVAKPAAFSGLASQDKVTYVPTKISLSLTLVPVVTRNDISKNFSLKDYAAGKLSAKTGGGIW